ncbi:MAG: hypothetical protein ABIR02_08205 [Novosphingobium sp.]
MSYTTDTTRQAQAAGGNSGAFTPPQIVQLLDWVRAAQPNARLIYAQGVILRDCCRPALREKVAALGEAGYLTSHFVRGRGGDPSIHIVMRTQRVYLKGATL